MKEWVIIGKKKKACIENLSVFIGLTKTNRFWLCCCFEAMNCSRFFMFRIICAGCGNGKGTANSFLKKRGMFIYYALTLKFICQF